MELTILAVPDCPNAPLLRERLTEALAGQPAPAIASHLVTTPEQAERLGMHGSPTLLINGADPFTEPGQPASLSCRLFRDAHGATSGAPSIDQLRRALSSG
ncbi:thioredoxin family protein [Streptomyces sp. NPDC006984]|uniref:thioredoxin family protein n=1 Tax=Streptomyces sp. NPDC006984 TaxID=3155463 RepID=UPI0033EA7C5D